MKIRYTRSALADLANIREYYGGLSPQALQNIATDIRETVDNLPSSISKGRITPLPDVWEKLTHKYKYLVPYWVTKDAIWILRVYDTRQAGYDLNKIMNDPKEFS